MISVVASTHAQAELAMQEINVPRSHWRLVRGVHDLISVNAQDIVVVYPHLEARAEVDAELLRIRYRDGRDFRAVWT